MIPTYQPDEAYFRATLKSVLQQDPGPAHMEIVVVDDASPHGSVEPIVRDVAGDHVRLVRLERNTGLAGAWNTCIAQARGEWIHILHQDDLVFPGFYGELEQLAQTFPSCGAMFTRHVFLDDRGHWKYVQPLEQHDPGILTDWLGKIAVAQRLQCVAIAVRREVYGRIGGFRADLRYLLDWEMWARIARHVPVAYSPRILAGYREHEKSETARLRRLGSLLAEQRVAHEIISRELPEPLRGTVAEAFAGGYAEQLWRHAEETFRWGDKRAAEAFLRAHWNDLSPYRRLDGRMLLLRGMIARLRRLFGPSENS